MPESYNGNEFPCADCPFIAQPAKGKVAGLGKVRVWLKSEGGADYHYSNNGGRIDSIEAGDINNFHSEMSARMKWCEGPIEVTPNLWLRTLGHFGIKSSISKKEDCGELLKTDLLSIAERHAKQQAVARMES